MTTRATRSFRMVVVLLASATFGLAKTSGYDNNQSTAGPGSVEPGSVNYVEGQVSADGQVIDQQAVGHLVLKRGQSLATGDGYVEVLLTPGTFLRVGNNSEFRLSSAGLADTRVDLVRGEALLEVDQIIEGTRLSVGLKNNSADVLKKGLYSFSANEQAVRVLDGKLKLMGGSNSRELGKHDQVLLANGDNLKKSEFSDSQLKREPLYVWSEARSRQESGANQLAAENSAGYVPEGTGWFWNPYGNYYGFWPTSAFLYSPFGFGFYGGYYPGYYGGFYPAFYRAGYYRGGYYRGYTGARYGHPAGVHASTNFHATAGCFQSHTAGGGVSRGGGRR